MRTFFEKVIALFTRRRNLLTWTLIIGLGAALFNPWTAHWMSKEFPKQRVVPVAQSQSTTCSRMVVEEVVSTDGTKRTITTKEKPIPCDDESITPKAIGYAAKLLFVLF